MSTETIQVVFKPLYTFAGEQYYHETLVYTNSQGQTFFTSIGPTNDANEIGASSAQLSATVSAASDVASNTPSQYGTLLAQINQAFNSSNSTGVTHGQNGTAYFSETVDFGFDLSSEWNTINATYASISNAGLTYSPLTQNSNSTATTALLAADITPPSFAGGFFATYWTPGASTTLTSVTTDSSGDTTYVFNEGTGSNADTITFVTDSSGNSVNLTLDEGSTVSRTETATTNSNGSQTVNLNGYNTNGSTAFTQDTSTNTSNQVSSTISGQGDATDLSDASISLAAGAQAAVNAANNAITLAANAALTLGAGAVGNTVGAEGASDSVNMSAAGGTVLSGVTTIVNSQEQVAFSTIATVTVAADTQASVAGIDGTMIINNDGTGGAIDNTINWSAGASQGQFFSSISSNASEEVTNYSGANLSGTLNDLIYNWKAGGSQTDVYTGLGSGISYEVFNYSGANTTGTDLENIANYTAGGSQTDLYSGLGSGISEEVFNFSGANTTGTDLENIYDWTAGGSQTDLYSGLGSGVSYEVFNFSGANTTGTDLENIYNWTAGGSQTDLYTGLGSGVSEEVFNYSGANTTGTDLENIYDYTAGNSQADLFNPATGVSSDDQNFTGANATGEVTTAILENTNNTSVDIRYSSGLGSAYVATFFSGSTELGIGAFLANNAFVSGYNPGTTFAEDTGTIDDGNGDEGDGGEGGDGGDGGDGEDDGDSRRGGSFGGITISSSNSTDALQNNQTVTVTGSGNTITVADDDTVTMNDSAPNTVILSGNDSTLSDSGTGDTYSISGQNNSISVGNAAITVDDGLSAAIDSTSSTISIGSNDSVSIDANSVANTSTMTGSGSTLADDGLGDNVVIGGSSNTVDFSGNSQGALEGSVVTFSGSNEVITLPGFETATVENGTQATVIGTDGTLAANNTGTSPQNIINWNAGGSDVQNFTINPNGGYVEDDLGYSGSNGSGTELYEQVITTSATGEASATISGQGSVDGLNDATIALDARASTTLTGSGNAVNIAGDNALTINGSSLFNTVNVTGSGNTIIDEGVGDDVTVGSSGAVDIFGNSANSGTATINGTNGLLELSGASAGNIVFASGASGVVKLDFAEGFSGTLAGLADGDSVDLGDFLFSGAPTISNVTGTGVTGTYTDVTISDNGVTAQLQLLNQFASQYAVSSSAYTLTADGTGGSAGTLFQLAAGH